MLWKHLLRAGFLGLLSVCGLRGASDSTLIYTIVAPAGAIASGEPWVVQIAALNTSSQPATVTMPPSLEGRLVDGSPTPPLVFRAVENVAPSATIAPGAFRLRTYSAHAPAVLVASPASLEISLPNGIPARAVFALSNPPSAPPKPDVAASQPEEQPTTSHFARGQRSAARVRRTFADRLGPHEPIYFIYGADIPAAKFQFSFKYKLLDFRDLAPQRMSRTVQFAFTQRSLWDIDDESSPFFDTSYIPEIMFESLAPEPTNGGAFNWLGLQAAYRHESNGRGGTTSRSLNVFYFRPVFAFGRLDGWHLLVVPEVFTYAGTLDDNPDIKDYRGYGKLHLVLGRDDGPSLLTTLWTGRDLNHLSAQFDLTIPLQTRLLDFETYLLFQYFRGYGESLLNYRDRTEAIRAGISLIR